MRMGTGYLKAGVAILALTSGLTVGAVAQAKPLEIATDASPVGLDPHVVTSFASILVTKNVYEGLTAIDDSLNVVPALAKSWTVSPDGKTYKFTLRDGVKFHNGEAFTAKDVVASINRIKDTKTGSPLASRFTVIAEAKEVSPTEVELTLSAPSAPLVSQLADLAIIPASAAGGGADLQKGAIGTGPFKFQQWVPDTYILLAKNESYYEKGLPKLDGLKFNIVPEATTRQVGLSSGTYQMLPNIDGALALTLKSGSSVNVLETTDLAYSLVGFNTIKAPFDKPQVREAFNYALNRGKLVDAAYFGLGQPAGPLSPALKDWAAPTSDFACYKTDPVKAKALLKEAGFADGVEVTLNVLGSVQTVVDAAQVVQAQLTAAGFKAKLNVQEQGAFIQDWRNSNFEAFVSLNGGGVDPDDYFTRTFKTGGSTNVYKYSNPEIDAKLDAARASNDKAERQKIYKEVQVELACKGPIAHLGYANLFTALGDGVDGYKILANRQTRYLRETTAK